MFNISNNDIITIVRGDSVEVKFILNLGTRLSPVYHDLTANDRIYFAVCEPNQPFEFALIKKVLTKDDYNPETHEIIIKLLPEETEYVIPGVYYYTIKLRKLGNVYGIDEEVHTLVSKRKFIIID